MVKPIHIIGALVGIISVLIIWGLWDSFSSGPKPEKPATLPVSYVPTPSDVVDRMLELANLVPGQMLYDLGSGDGRIVIEANLQYQARAIGFELDDALVALSRANVTDAGINEMVRIDQADILTLDLGEADVVTLYLSEALNGQLIPQLQRMKDGALIISHDFLLAGHAPDKLVQIVPRGEDDRPHTIYVWQTPLHGDNSTPQAGVPSRTPDIGFVPTPMPVVEEMLRLANLADGQKLYDLGSGDGRILIGAAAEYGAQAVGYEIDLRLIGLSEQKARDAGVDTLVDVRATDLFSADLSDADVVTLYLSPAMNKRLVGQLLTMRAGARIISNKYDIPGVKRQTVINLPPTLGAGPDHVLYLWVAPLELHED
jgi:predicted RNA methylase